MTCAGMTAEISTTMNGMFEKREENAYGKPISDDRDVSQVPRRAAAERARRHAGREHQTRVPACQRWGNTFCQDRSRVQDRKIERGEIFVGEAKRVCCAC